MYNSIKNRLVKYHASESGFLPFFILIALVSVIALLMRLWLCQ